MKTMVSRLGALLIVFLITSLSATAIADTIYVAPYGNDSRSRVQATRRGTPFRTIQRGLNEAYHGDVVLVLDGTYNEHVSFPRNGQSGRPIQLRAENIHGAVINGSISAYDRTFLRCENFEVTNFREAAPQSKGIIFGRCHHVWIRNNKVHDCRGGGISCDQSDWVIIEWNLVYRNAFWDPGQHSGISIYQPQYRGRDNRGYGIIIRNNTCYSNENKVNNALFGRPTDGNGIAVDDFKNVQAGGNGVTYDRPTLIANNFCLFNGGQGIHCYLANNIFVRNNTCYQNMFSFDFGGEVSVSESSKVVVYNNILYARSGKNVSLEFDSTQAFWNYNILFNGPVFGARNGPQTIYRDPELQPGTLRPRSTSPAIDSALTHQGVFPFDVDGQLRTVNGAMDIGAKEFSYTIDY